LAQLKIFGANLNALFEQRRFKLQDGWRRQKLKFFAKPLL
jgi:hypothetical protein